MALKYFLTPNLLTKNEGKYKAQNTDREAVYIQDLAEDITSKGSTITKAEFLAVYEELSDAIVNALRNGKSIYTDLFTIKPSISGVFTHAEETFSAEKHDIRINMSAGTRLKESVKNIEVKKVNKTQLHPILSEFTDIKTGEINSHYTPGNIVSIKGRNLKFNPADNKQGIYLKSNTQEVKVSGIVKNKPSELMFFMPDNINGDIMIEIRAIYRNGKNIRTGILPYKLVSING